jgi:hypothetical protein
MMAEHLSLLQKEDEVVHTQCALNFERKHRFFNFVAYLSSDIFSVYQYICLSGTNVHVLHTNKEI